MRCAINRAYSIGKCIDLQLRPAGLESQTTAAVMGRDSALLRCQSFVGDGVSSASSGRLALSRGTEGPRVMGRCGRDDSDDPVGTGTRWFEHGGEAESSQSRSASSFSNNDRSDVHAYLNVAQPQRPLENLTVGSHSGKFRAL